MLKGCTLEGILCVYTRVLKPVGICEFIFDAVYPYHKRKQNTSLLILNSAVHQTLQQQNFDILYRWLQVCIGKLVGKVYQSSNIGTAHLVIALCKLKILNE
jgi:hypothetical protein